MFIKTQNEIKSLMPTARWSRPDDLLGYLEEEELGALEPLLGMELYEFLCKECERLRKQYVDITSSTITPLRKAKDDPGVPCDDVTEQMNLLQQGRFGQPAYVFPPDYDDVPEKDMITVQLIRICQQIEFYRMLSHKAGLLTVSFNEGGGMNMVSADGYEPADEKRMERVVKDAFMSAGRSTDSLLLFLEADAKGGRLFTDLWSHADAYYLHKDLLFQTARVLNEYLDIKSERMAYVELVRDTRFCQRTYLKPRLGARLLGDIVVYANTGKGDDSSSSSSSVDDPMAYLREDKDKDAVYREIIDMLRTALAFYVESRRTELGPAKERLARRDSMSDAQQAMAEACEYIAGNLDVLGDAATESPIYKEVRAREEKERWEKEHREQAQECRRRERCRQQHRKLFTAFPATHRNPEVK